MAKPELIAEAKTLGIEVTPEDTVKTLQAKIDAKKKESASGVQAVPEVKGGLKRIKVNHEELMKLQAEHKLVGYDPATNEAIVK